MQSWQRFFFFLYEKELVLQFMINLLKMLEHFSFLQK